jgi:hypothetical protein
MPVGIAWRSLSTPGIADNEGGRCLEEGVGSVRKKPFIADGEDISEK